VPDDTLSTQVARGLLPDVVPHADAAYNAARAALLVHALSTAPTLLFEATGDRLHQRQRARAMPESIDLIDRLRADGHAAVVSGAGPSVLVLAVAPDDAPEAALLRFTPPGWSVLPLGIDVSGAEVLVGAPEVSSP
jgi:homoserine kinase